MKIRRRPAPTLVYTIVNEKLGVHDKTYSPREWARKNQHLFSANDKAHHRRVARNTPFYVSVSDSLRSHAEAYNPSENGRIWLKDWSCTREVENKFDISYFTKVEPEVEAKWLKYCFDLWGVTTDLNQAQAQKWYRHWALITNRTNYKPRYQRPVLDPVPKIRAREMIVLKGIASGKTTAEIAGELAASNKSVEYFRLQLKNLLGISSNEGLVRFAIWTGISPEDKLEQIVT